MHPFFHLDFPILCKDRANEYNSTNPLIFKDFKLPVLKESPFPDLGIAWIMLDVQPRWDFVSDQKAF
jgi:hypothetical protein